MSTRFDSPLPRGSATLPPADRQNVSDTAAALDVALRLSGATIGAPAPGEIALLPAGITPHSLKALHDEWRANPERRSGTAELADLASFIAHTNRFKDQDSAVFVHRDEERPAFTSVLDYHRAGPPEIEQPARWGTHRGRFQPKVSETWRAWKAADGKALSQGDFATLLEDRILDIAAPPETQDSGSTALVAALGGRIGTQTEMLTISRGLRLREHAEVTNTQVLETGEVEVVYKTELRDHTNAPLRLPTCFSVQAPVFEGGPAYRLWLRVRVRKAEHKIIWIIQRWRPDLIVQHALDEMIAKVSADTGLPVLLGSPE